MRVMVLILAVFFAATLLARVAGVAGVSTLDSWRAAVRVGLAAMLLLTGAAHFTGARHALVQMIPSVVPFPMGVIYFTGVCEILGGIGLLVPQVRTAAGWALVVFFVAVLPANIHAAQMGMTLSGQPVPSIALRVPIQILFIWLTWWSAVSGIERASSGAR